jgi:hypothetical protein
MIVLLLIVPIESAGFGFPKVDLPNIGGDLGKAGEELKTGIGNLNPAGVSEELWGEGGRLAYTSAAAVMSKRSPTGEPLSDAQKSALRPYFCALVDKVTVHWATPPLDEWAANNFRVRLDDPETVAQTYGYDIYFKYRSGEYDSELPTIVHELVHVQQFEKYGSSFSNFGYHYFKNYKKANLNYLNNDMEVEANQREDSFTAGTLPTVSCETSSSPTDIFPGQLQIPVGASSSTFQNGDAILLRTRANHFLNTDNGVGPTVKLSPAANRDPSVSDEVWWVERIAGSGPVQNGDAILLRTRASRFLNTDNGVGPVVKLSPAANRDPSVSDEIWWVELV